MKSISLVFLIVFPFFNDLACQNLVPNSSFEELRGLPVKLLPVNNFEYERRSGNKAFENNLNYWFSGNKTTPDLRILSDDYYHNCKAKYGHCDQARTGKNVVAIITYMENKDTDSYREYLEAKLKKPLKVGTKTYVELWIKSEQKSTLVSNNVGFYFSNKKVFAEILDPIRVTPHVNHHLVIRRTNNEWIKIEGEFIPNKPFEFLTIGNFFSNKETKVEDNKAFESNRYKTPNAYYIIDDIRVWQEGDKAISLLSDKKISVGATIELENVEFDTNSSTLKASSYAELEELVSFMKASEKVKIEIHGHTDDVGTQASNQKLSNERAKRIYNYLASNKIAKERMSYKSFGESLPLSSNLTEEGKKRNRRVEFVILSME